MFYFIQFLSFFVLSFLLFFLFKFFLKEKLTCFYISFLSCIIMLFVSLNDISDSVYSLKYLGFQLSQGQVNNNSMSYELLARFSGLMFGLLLAVSIALILNFLFKNVFKDKGHNNLEQPD